MNRTLPPVLLLSVLATACGRIPGVVRWYTGADQRVLWYQTTTEKVAALTIDDGPSSHTDSILDVLSANDARATFFLIGSNVDGNRAVVERLIREGHEVGNHTMLDVPSAGLSSDAFRASYEQTDSILRSFAVRPVWFRPGAGRFNDPMLAFLCEKGSVGALGEVYPLDNVTRSVSVSVDFILQKTRPGSVIILHDGRDRGRRTARALALALPVLTSSGYRIVTLTELVGGPEGVAKRLDRCAEPGTKPPM